MAQKTVMDCPNCGSPWNTLIQTDGHDRLFKCEACDHVWESTKSGLIINPEIKKCENCGQVNGPGARICQRCGTQIRYECPNCGSLVDLTATYCPFCEIHIQNYLEERKRRQAEERRATGVRKIQKLESEIQSLENIIASKEGNIRQANRKLETLRGSDRKLYYFGKAGLSEEEKSIYTQASASIGCGTKVIAVVLAMTALSLSSQLLIALTATSFYALQPDSPSQNGQFSLASFGLCMSIFLAIGVGWLVYTLIMMLARQKSVDHLASEQERWLLDLRSEKRDLQNKLERLKKDLEVAKRQVL